MEKADDLDDKEQSLVERLGKDKQSPHSIGPRMPGVLINYIYRQLEIERGSYTDDDIITVVTLWNKFQEYKQTLPIREHFEKLEKLHGEQ